jgi:hypothetical protein
MARTVLIVGGAAFYEDTGEPVPQPATDPWVAVRARRDQLLAACDWIVVRAAEAGQPVAAAWATYRQALRDITLQPSPTAVVWPVQPPTGTAVQP